MALKNLFGLGLGALVAALPMHAQAIPEDEVRLISRPYTPPALSLLRIQSNLVEVGVVVRDSKGRVVAGLHQSDFQLFDNGKPQTITFFSAEGASPIAPPAAAPHTSTPVPKAEPRLTSTTPRFVALFFDDLNMGLGDLVSARKAAQAFVDGGSLEHGDRVGLFTSSRSVTLEFTENTGKLAESLAQLRPHPRNADEGPASCPPMMPYEAHLIANVHDDQALDLGIAQGVAALCLAGMRRADQALMVQRRADQVLSVAEQFAQETLGSLNEAIGRLGRMPGRRMLVMVSSGFFSGTLLRQQDQLVQAALRSDIVINSLDAKGLVAEGSEAVSRPSVGPLRGDQMAYADQLASQQKEVFNDLMASLSRDTGGVFFHNNNDLGKGLRDAFAIPAARYVLSFSPRDLKPDGHFHNLKVKVAGPGTFSVEARRGYFAPAKKEPSRPPSVGALDSAVLGSNKIADFPAEVTAQLEKLNTGEPVLRVTVHVDVRNLPFQRHDDRSVERLRLVTALLDSEGNFLLGTEAVIDLSLKDATLAQLASQGFNQKLSLQAPAGSYNLREVVQEAVQGRIAAVSHPVEIP